MTKNEIEKLAEKVRLWIIEVLKNRLSQNEVAFEISELIEKEKAGLLKDAIELAEIAEMEGGLAGELGEKFLAKYKKEKK